MAISLSVAKNLLIIETEPILSKFLNRLMLKAAYSPTVVNSYRQALTFLNSQKYDLITVNVGQQAYNGNSFMRELQSRKINIPVVVITGHPGLVDQSLPFHAILKKPFNRDELLALMRQIFTQP